MSFVITIDGPAAAGKSSTARAVAARLGFLYLDTGALYRALALKVLGLGIPIRERSAIERCADEIRLDLSGSPDRPQVYLDGEDVGDRIRAPAVGELASRLAAEPGVRRRLVEVQRGFAGRGPVVAEGRDLGTVVFPDAEVKLYLDADLDSRARRRLLDVQGLGIEADLEQVRAELAQRDARDRGRADGPLVRAPDATVVDTSGMTLEAQIEAVLALARKHPRFPNLEQAR